MRLFIFIKIFCWEINQQTWRNSSKLPHQTLMDPNTTDWGWSWLERWIASRPWDPQSKDDQASFKNTLKCENSIQTSPARSKTLKSASQVSIQWPVKNDSKSKIKSEVTNRRHSIGGGSSTNVRDEESVGSSSSRRGSLDNTETVKSKVNVVTTTTVSNVQPVKSKTSVGTKRNVDNTQALKSKVSVGTTGNLGNTQAVKSNVNVGTTSLQKKKVVSDKKKPPQAVLPKKRLSSSTSLGTTKKLSDTDKATSGVANGEKKRRNGGSS